MDCPPTAASRICAAAGEASQSGSGNPTHLAATKLIFLWLAQCNTKHETKREGGGRDGQATRLIAMRFAANLNVCFWLDECEAETVSSDIKVGASAREPRRALHALQHVLQEHRAQARSKLLRSRHSIWHRQQWDLDQRCLLSASQAQENAKKGGKKGHWRRRAVSRDSSGRVLRG